EPQLRGPPGRGRPHAPGEPRDGRRRRDRRAFRRHPAPLVPPDVRSVAESRRRAIRLLRGDVWEHPGAPHARLSNRFQDDPRVLVDHGEQDEGASRGLAIAAHAFAQRSHIEFGLRVIPWLPWGIQWIPEGIQWITRRQNGSWTSHRLINARRSPPTYPL